MDATFSLSLDFRWIDAEIKFKDKIPPGEAFAHVSVRKIRTQSISYRLDLVKNPLVNHLPQENSLFSLGPHSLFPFALDIPIKDSTIDFILPRQYSIAIGQSLSKIEHFAPGRLRYSFSFENKLSSFRHFGFYLGLLSPITFHLSDRSFLDCLMHPFQLKLLQDFIAAERWCRANLFPSNVIVSAHVTHSISFTGLLIVSPTLAQSGSSLRYLIVSLQTRLSQLVCVAVENEWILTFLALLLCVPTYVKRIGRVAYLEEEMGLRERLIKEEGDVAMNKIELFYRLISKMLGDFAMESVAGKMMNQTLFTPGELRKLLVYGPNADLIAQLWLEAFTPGTGYSSYEFKYDFDLKKRMHVYSAHMHCSAAFESFYKRTEIPIWIVEKEKVIKKTLIFSTSDSTSLIEEKIPVASTVLRNRKRKKYDTLEEVMMLPAESLLNRENSSGLSYMRLPELAQCFGRIRIDCPPIFSLEFFTRTKDFEDHHVALTSIKNWVQCNAKNELFLHPSGDCNNLSSLQLIHAILSREFRKGQPIPLRLLILEIFGAAAAQHHLAFYSSLLIFSTEIEQIGETTSDGESSGDEDWIDEDWWDEDEKFAFCRERYFLMSTCLNEISKCVDGFGFSSFETIFKIHLAFKKHARWCAVEEKDSFLCSVLRAAGNLIFNPASEDHTNLFCVMIRQVRDCFHVGNWANTLSCIAAVEVLLKWEKTNSDFTCTFFCPAFDEILASKPTSPLFIRELVKTYLPYRPGDLPHVLRAVFSLPNRSLRSEIYTVLQSLFKLRSLSLRDFRASKGYCKKVLARLSEEGTDAANRLIAQISKP